MNNRALIKKAANRALPSCHFQLLKFAEMCNFYIILMHKDSMIVHFSSFFAQKICKCEIKVVTLHPNFENVTHY